MSGHPLDQLSGQEILAASAAVRAFFKARGDGLQPRFNNITLQEPSRQELLAFESVGARPARIAHIICTEQRKRNPIELNVEFKRSVARVVSMKVCSGITSMIFDDQFEIEAAMKNDPQLNKLVEQYGLSMDNITIDPWIMQASPEIPTEEKWSAGFLYWSPVKDGNYYAHPLPWMPIVDCSTLKVLRIENAHKSPPPVNEVTSEYHLDLVSEPIRAGLKPLVVSQPEGPSFEVSGNLVSWQKWQFRVGFNYREGVVVYNIGYNDGGRLRPILHRMSMAEMAVPYGDPQPPFNKKLAFDAGDVGLGLATNSLSLGCDCVGTVHYFDGIMHNSKGEPVIIKNAICLHEEDDGMAWKHTDYHNEHCELRRGRRLVVQFIATLANYEYAFSYHFKTDASIAYEVKLTGIVSTHIPSPADGADPEFGTLVLPQVNAQYHQHLFCCRMDWAVDDETGGSNLVVSEVDVELLRGSRNTAGNAFVKKETDLVTEAQGQRMVDVSKARFWKVKNVAKKNSVTGHLVAFKLQPANTQTLLGLPGSATMTRAGFASKSLWVTPYAADEQWPGGKYPLQNPQPGGLLEWTKQNRRLSSPVMWHVFGATHIPRPEDFPVMPVETVGFHLKPVGFFNKNPANDLPPTKDLTSKLYHDQTTKGHTHWVSRL